MKIRLSSHWFLKIYFLKIVPLKNCSFETFFKRSLYYFPTHFFNEITSKKHQNCSNREIQMQENVKSSCRFQLTISFGQNDKFGDC